MNLKKTGIALAIALMGTSAHAAIISNWTTTITGAADTAESSSMFGPETATFPLSQSLTGSIYAGTASDLSGATAGVWVQDQGVFRLSTGGWGNFGTISMVNNTFTLVNNSASAVDYTLHVLLNRASGYVDLSAGNMESGFEMLIAKDGTSLFEHSVAFRSDGTYSEDLGPGFVLSQYSGQSYNGSMRTTYSWADTWLDVDLGTVGANESVEISYDFISYAFGDQDTAQSCYYFSYGCGTGIATGDPFNIDDPVMSVEARLPAGTVPEPATAWLGLTGLVGMAVLNRRRKTGRQG